MYDILKHRIGRAKIGIVLFLGLLLLIAPCSVRNAFEQLLGLKATKILNPAKITIQQVPDCCVTYSQAEVAKVKLVEKAPKFESFAAANQFSNFNIDLPASFNSRTWVIQGRKNIPLYILYQRLKYFI